MQYESTGLGGIAALGWQLVVLKASSIIQSCETFLREKLCQICPASSCSPK